MHICVFPARREEMTIGFGIAGRHLAICLLALWQSLRVGREAGTFSLPLHFFKQRGDWFFGHLWWTFAVVNFILLWGPFLLFCGDLAAVRWHALLWALKCFPVVNEAFCVADHLFHVIWKLWSEIKQPAQVLQFSI